MLDKSALYSRRPPDISYYFASYYLVAMSLCQNLLRKAHKIGGSKQHLFVL